MKLKEDAKAKEESKREKYARLAKEYFIDQYGDDGVMLGGGRIAPTPDGDAYVFLVDFGIGGTKKFEVRLGTLDNFEARQVELANRHPKIVDPELMPSYEPAFTEQEPFALEDLKITGPALDLAKELGVDPYEVTPTGKGGKILSRDVRMHYNAQFD